MNRTRGLAVAALLLLVAACGSDNPTGAAAQAVDESLVGRIDGAGSSAQESAMAAWLAGFQLSYPNVSVSYDPVGSGGGRTQFLDGGISFAGTDAALTDEELARARARCGGTDPIELPLYISPIAVVFNLPGIDSLNLSPETIGGIFNRTITRWDAPQIAADNPGVELPDARIIPVNRSDESGTTENFLEYLDQAAGDAWPHGVSGHWPLSGGQAAQGNSGVVQTILGGVGTIGYTDASKAGDLGRVHVRVGEEFVEPSPFAAAQIVDLSPRLEGRGENSIVLELDRTPDDPAYPIVLVAYTVACAQYPTPEETELVRTFLQYVASEEGQGLASTAAGSAPISDVLRAEVTAILGDMEAAA